MKIVPIRNTVVCEKVEETENRKSHIFIVNKSGVPTYKILDYSAEGDENFIFKTGDVVIVDGTGDEFEVDGKNYYMFKTKNVVAKVSN